MEAVKRNIAMASPKCLATQTEADHWTDSLYILQVFTEIFKRVEDKTQRQTQKAFAKDSIPDRAVRQHKEIQYALNTPVFQPE